MGKERGARRASTLLTITDLHILPLFLQQHEGDGDGKKNENTKIGGRKEELGGLAPSLLLLNFMCVAALEQRHPKQCCS
jgi:hypothetical protein